MSLEIKHKQLVRLASMTIYAKAIKELFSATYKETRFHF